MEILFVTLVEEYLVVVEISVVIINHESDYSLIYAAYSMPVFEAQDILIHSIIAPREYTQTVKYINIPALSGMGMRIEWRNVDRWLQRTGK